MRPAWKIAVLDDYQRVAHDVADWESLAPAHPIFFHGPVCADRLPGVLAPFDALVLMRERTLLNRGLIEQLPALRFVTTMGGRSTAIDLSALAERGIPVSGTDPAPDADLATATMTWALILAITRDIVGAASSVRAGGWAGKAGCDLQGKTLGVVGLGKVGIQVAHMARAFGMEVVAWSPKINPQRASAAGALSLPLDALLSKADVVSLHLRLTDATRGLIDARRLMLMRPQSYLINTARGALVDEGALFTQLRARRIAGAALDTFGQEPLGAASPFRALDNVLATPHLGHATRNNFRFGYSQAVENIAAAMAGRPIRLLRN